MRPLSLFLLLAAFLACAPNPHLTKAQLLACVKPYPDEYRIARAYGVPTKIETLPSSQSYPDATHAAYLWDYSGAREAQHTFSFTWDGRFIVDSQYIPPPKPR